MVGNQTTEQLRQLRARIARLRRRLDRRADKLLDGSILTGSWRAYVQKHPGRSLLAAAGVGIVFSNLFTARNEVSRLGESLSQMAFGGEWGRVWHELWSLLTGDDAAARSGDDASNDDARDEE